MASGAGADQDHHHRERWRAASRRPMHHAAEGDDAGQSQRVHGHDLDQVGDQALGFSNGWAELALKMPPPLVPSCLIASWLAVRIQRDGLLGALDACGP